MRFANLHPNLPEASLAAHFEYLCMLGGAERMAYVPVVASGYVGLVILQILRTYPNHFAGLMH